MQKIRWTVPLRDETSAEKSLAPFVGIQSSHVSQKALHSSFSHWWINAASLEKKSWVADCWRGREAAVSEASAPSSSAVRLLLGHRANRVLWVCRGTNPSCVSIRGVNTNVADANRTAAVIPDVLLLHSSSRELRSSRVDLQPSFHALKLTLTSFPFWSVPTSCSCFPPSPSESPKN